MKRRASNKKKGKSRRELTRKLRRERLIVRKLRRIRKGYRSKNSSRSRKAEIKCSGPPSLNSNRKKTILRSLTKKPETK